MTASETAVLAVLREVIGNTAIAQHDDFYAVGGHSLHILQITRRLRSEYGLQLALREFWRNSNISALIAACEPTPENEPAGDFEQDPGHDDPR